MVSVEQKDTTKPKKGRREDVLLATSKENTKESPKSYVSPNCAIKEVLN